MVKTSYTVPNKGEETVNQVDRKATADEDGSVKGAIKPKLKRKLEDKLRGGVKPPKTTIPREPKAKPISSDSDAKVPVTEVEPKQVTEAFTIETIDALREFLVKKWHINTTASDQFICRKMIDGVRHVARISPALFDQIKAVQEEVEKELEEEKIAQDKSDKEFAEESRKQKVLTSQPIVAGEIAEIQWLMRLEPTLGRKVYHTLVRYVGLTGDELYDADAAVTKIMSYIDNLLDFEKSATEFDKVKQENMLLLDFGKTIGQKYCDLRTEYLKDQALDRLMTRVLCQTCTRNVLEVRMQYGTVQSVPELMAIAEAQKPKEPVILNQGV